MKLKNVNPFLPLTKIFNAVKRHIERARALSQGDEQLAVHIKNYMSGRFNYDADFFLVEIKDTKFYQQGHTHKGKSVRVTMKEHIKDYALVQRMASDLGRKFTLSNRYLVGLYNGQVPKLSHPLVTKDAVQKTAKVDAPVLPVPRDKKLALQPAL